MRLTIRADLRHTAESLKQMKKAVGASVRAFLSEKAPPILADYTRRVFDTEGFGNWKPVRSRPGGRILHKSGRLRRSYIQPRSADNVLEVTQNSLRYGSKVFYAGFHEYGTRLMSPRRVIGSLDGAKIQAELAVRLSDSVHAKIDRL